jgi:hypothetical protein
VGVSPELVKIAFSLADNEFHPEVLEVNNRLFLVRLANRERADPAKLAEERDNIEATLLAGRRAAVVEEFTKSLRDKARITKAENLLEG